MPDEFKGKPIPEVLNGWTRGVSVTLASDPQVPEVTGDRRKAYAHRSPDGLDFGLALIQYGFAYARRDYKYTRQSAYIAAEQAARSAGRGYWFKQNSTPAPTPSASPIGSSPVSTGPATAPASKQVVSSHVTASMPAISSDTLSPSTMNDVDSAKDRTVSVKRPKKRYARQPDTLPGGQGFFGLPMFGAPAFGVPGSIYVRGYYRNDGTYVQPYYRRPPGG
jgi:hypothetical protein